MCKESSKGAGMFEYDNTRCKRPGYMTDLMDGEAIKEHMNWMHEKFQAKHQELVTAGETRKIIEHSLVLSFFYDGDQLFERSNDSMWPLVCMVLNCDPSYRTKDGLGLFNIGMHNMKVGSGAEQMMMNDLKPTQPKSGTDPPKTVHFFESGFLELIVIAFMAYGATFAYVLTKYT